MPAINAVIVIVYFYDRSFCVVNASADDSAMCMYFRTHNVFKSNGVFS